MTNTPSFVGIDVSKAQLDVAVSPAGERDTLVHDAAGIDTVVARLGHVPPPLIVLEATGGLERPLVGALVAAALPVIVANPRQVRDFAKATGQLAKTDQLDARVLARFAEAVRPALRPHPDPTTEAFGEPADPPPAGAGEAHRREESAEHGPQAGAAANPDSCDLVDRGADPPQRGA